jgi:predicted outer membrane repeat protein
LDGGEYTITGNRFIENEATGVALPPDEEPPRFSRGGAIYAASSVSEGLQGTIGNNSFTRNRAFEDGGAIRVQRGSSMAPDAELALTENTFEGNVSRTDDGGAISINIRGTVSLRDNTFTQNQAENNGGAVHASCSATLTIEGGRFAANKTVRASAGLDNPGGGGAVYARNSEVFIRKEVEFSGNTTNNSGGALLILGAQDNLLACNDFAIRAIIEECTFEGNRAVVSGGAVRIQRKPETLELASFTVSSCMFLGNAISKVGIARLNGAALFLLDCNDAPGNAANRISKCTFDNHEVSAVRLEETKPPAATSYRLIDNAFTSNAGTALFVINVSPDVEGGEFSKNHVGVRFDSSTSKLKNVTFRGQLNLGILSRKDSHPRVESCTLDGDGLGAIGVRVESDASVTVKSCNVKGHTQLGVQRIFHAPGTSAVDCRSNFWGNASGPLDDSDDRAAGGDFNPGGTGDRVTDKVNYRPFSATEFP